MERRSFHVLALYDFKVGRSAAESARSIREAFGEEAPTERAVQRWYTRFRSGDESVEDKPRSGRPSQCDEDPLSAAVEANSRATCSKLAGDLGVTGTTSGNHLTAMGKTKKRDQRVSRDRNDRQTLASPASSEGDHTVILSSGRRKKRKSKKKKAAKASTVDVGEANGAAVEAHAADKERSGSTDDPQPRMKKRRLHTFERARLAYDAVTAERAAETERRRLNREQKEAAIASYNAIKRKMDKALLKRNKRGQPNLNAQIEVLLEKIQKRRDK